MQVNLSFLGDENDESFLEADGDSRLLKWEIEDIGKDCGQVIGTQF